MNINNYTEMIKAYINLKKKKNTNDGDLDHEQRLTVLENTLKNVTANFEMPDVTISTQKPKFEHVIKDAEIELVGIA